jgi:hypothetical protein
MAGRSAKEADRSAVPGNSVANAFKDPLGFYVSQGGLPLQSVYEFAQLYFALPMPHVDRLSIPLDRFPRAWPYPHNANSLQVNRIVGRTHRRCSTGATLRGCQSVEQPSGRNIAKGQKLVPTINQPVEIEL